MKPWALRTYRMSTAPKKDNTLVSLYSLRGCMWCQADNTKFTHWSEEESGERPPHIGPTAHVWLRQMPSTSHRVVAIKSDGSWPSATAVYHGHGGWPWWTVVVDEEVQNSEEKALPPSPSVLPTPYGMPPNIWHWILGLTCWFQMHRAMNASLENVLTLIPLIGQSLTLWETPSKISSLVPFSSTSLELWLHWILGEGWS